MAGKALYLIAAMERKQGIGFKNDLPWHLEREYAYFERMSTVTQQPNKMVIISAYFLPIVERLSET
jgi:dihydrofolate reductase